MIQRLRFGIPFVCFTVWIASASAEIEWMKDSVKEVYEPRGDFYCYAPSATRAGDVERYWCCQNEVAGVIRDHIYYVEQIRGKITACKVVLNPGPAGAWDCFHVCDPSVVVGEFHLGGVRYSYAMFYLGNNVDASANNQIGVAFSNDPASKWVRYRQPIIRFQPNGQWGVGQPSVISLDGKGDLLVFYTKGTRHAAGYVRNMNLNDMKHPIVGEEKRLPISGLTRTDDGADYLNNFDVAYDASRNRFIAVREQHPYPQTEPKIISTALQIISISTNDLLRTDGRWTVEGSITPELTGQPRNHNAGIERTLLGTLPNPDRIRVVFTDSCAEPDCGGKNPLWTYALWEITGKITGDK